MKKPKNRNYAQKELIENFAGKSVAHKSKKDYSRKEKFKKPLFDS
jgi:hypothetical protein